jgi:hypothetical protein
MAIVLFLFCATLGFLFANIQYFLLDMPLLTSALMYFGLGVGLPITILTVAELEVRDLLAVAFGVGRQKAATA